MIIQHLTGKKIISPHTVFDICQSLLSSEDAVDRDKEHVWVFHLDARYCARQVELVCLGGLNSAVVRPAEVFRRAVMNGSLAIIIAHNHPSGNSEFSQEDLSFTKQLIKGGNILGIKVLDHVVIGHDDYVSYREKGYDTDC